MIQSLRSACILSLAVAACSNAAPPPTAPAKVATPAPTPPAAAAPTVSGDKQALFARGEKIYRSQCISCHNRDPHKDGAIGPANYGASKELLEARVLRAEYPAGYVPKRKTKQMLKMPQLKNEIDALHVYLNN